MANNPPFFAAGTSAPSIAQQSVPNTPGSVPSPAAGIPPPSAPPQTAAFQQNAQLPGIDMSALAGISPDQVALIARLLQSGALPLPPPPPSAPSAAATASTNHTSPNTPTQAATAQERASHADREDGEVEEGEVDGAAMLRSHDNSPHQGPSGLQHAKSRSASRQDPRTRKPSAAPTPRRSSVNRDMLTSTGSGSRDIVLMAKEQQSRDFVLAMHQAGYTYRQLAEQVSDPKSLRRVFKHLGLPVSSDYGLPTATQVGKQPASQTHAPAVTERAQRPSPENAQPPSTAKSAVPPKPAAKADRSAYLAKLQALKAGKAAPQTSPSASQSPAQAADTNATPAAIAPTALPAKPSVATVTPNSKAVKTELARQRLEAFKAERAAKLAASRTPSTAAAAGPTTQSAGPDSLGAGLGTISAAANQYHPLPADPQNVTAPAASQPAFSPIAPTPSHSANGLPGLFMRSGAQEVPEASPSRPDRTEPPSYNESTQTTLPLKRLATQELPEAATPSKRPFGQSRSASEDDSFIIENSDDEDQRMDVDSKDVGANAPSGHDISSIAPRSSPAATSGATTPGSAAYEQKLKAIDDLHRKIAEKEARKKAQDRPPQSSVFVTSPGLPGISSPVSNASAPFHPLSRPAEQQAAPESAPERPSSAGALKLKQQKEELRQRIAELENARRPAAVSLQADDGFPAPQPEMTTAAASAARGPVAALLDDEPQPSTALAAPSTTAKDGRDEEGEVEDESDFDFYGDEEATDSPKPSADPAPVESQAATDSAIAEAGDTYDEADYPYEEAALTEPVSGEELNRAELTAPAEPSRSDGVDDGSSAAKQAIDEGLQATRALAQNHQRRPESAPSESDTTGEESSASSDGLNATADGAQEERPSDTVLEGTSEAEDSDDEMYDPEDLETSQKASSAQNAGDNRASQQRDLEHRHDAFGDNQVTESSDASSSGSSVSEEEYEPGSAVASADQSLTQIPAHEADDLASELQPQHDESSETEAHDQPPVESPKRYFTPYESVLKQFKDYRYHPRYLDNVPHGFHSRTYNHQIDPNKPLCRTEALGGRCYDPHCESQHFDRMAISDNLLLQQMGTKNIPATTREEMEKWNKGLTGIIRSLKAEDVRDATSIAIRIAQFRRDFIGDPSRIISSIR